VKTIDFIIDCLVEAVAMIAIVFCFALIALILGA